MQISCERCGTTYALDDRLIPPGGAPVQCTRCSHVFTAMPAGAAPPPAVLPQLAPPQSQANKTQMFGAANAAGPSQSKPPAAPAPPPPRSNTQMFGANPPPPASNTAMFGAVPPGMRASGPKPSPAFGAGTAAPPPQMPSEPRTAQMFTGSRAPTIPAAPAAPPPADELHEPDRSKTQMFGLVRPPAPAPEAPPPDAPSISTTQVFGSLPPSITGDVPPPPSSSRTITEQQFSAVQTSLPPAQSFQPITAPSEDEMDRMGFEDTVRRPIPQMPGRPALQRKPVGGADASMATTQMFGAPDEEALEEIWASRSGPPTPLETPALLRSRLEGTATPVETPRQGMFHGASTPVEVQAGGRIDLPPEPPTFGSDPAHEAVTSSDLETERLQRQLRRRNRIALGAVVAVVVVVAAGVGIRMAMSGLRRPIPADAQAQRESARLLVRRDDTVSRQRATDELTFLTSKHPAYLAAHSDLVVALALQLDDARLTLKQLQAEAEELNREVARLQEAKVPGDWQNRVNVKIDRIAEIKRQSDPLVDRATTLDTRVNEAFRVLGTLEPSGPEDQRVLVRAQAVYFGIKGNDQAITLAERYRATGATDGWGDVARAELALNTRVPPETVAAALESMERLATADATFLRSYVLAARLAMLQHRYDAAVTSLESALALNPGHDEARQLLEWVRSREQGAEASPGSP